MTSIQIINTLMAPSAQSEASSNVQSDQDQGGQFSEVIQQANSERNTSGKDEAPVSDVETDVPVKNKKDNTQSADEKDKKAAEYAVMLNTLPMQLIVSNLPKPTPEVTDPNAAKNEKANKSDSKKPVQNAQMHKMEKALATDAKKNQSLQDPAKILAEKAATQAKQTADTSISGSSAQAWQIAQANTLAKMENLTRLALSKADNQKAALSEIKQIKNEKQLLETKAAHMELDKTAQQSASLYPDNKKDINTTETKSTQDFQAVLAQQSAPSMNEQQTKTAETLSQMGHLIQAQVSAAISDHSQSVSNMDTKSADATAPIRKYDYDMTMELSKDHIDSTIKESYSANIKIYPPELGTVTAKLKMDNGSAQLVLVTENEKVKGIVEANLPQLREHFQQSNLTLADVQVQTASSGSNDQFTGKQQAASEFVNNNQGVSTPAVSQPTTEPQKNSNKIIDTYA